MRSPIKRSRIVGGGGGPYVTAQGLLSSGGTVRGAYIRGIIPEPKKKSPTSGEHMAAGSLEGLRPGEFGIVLGIELARALACCLAIKSC